MANLYTPTSASKGTDVDSLSGAPDAHAASHATGGSDPITADDIGALAVTELNKPVHGLDMDGEVISGLAEPSADDHAATRLYVDTAIAGVGSGASHTGGTLAARPAASAATAGSTYLALDVGAAGTLYLGVTDGAGGYDWAPVYLASDSDPEGTATIADGADGVRKTSADVAAMLAAADAAAILAALGAVPASRTVAGAALSGDITAATLRAALGVPAPTYAGPFSGAAYLSAASGAVDPSLDKGHCLAVRFYKIGNLAGAAGIMAAHLKSDSQKGWDLGYDDVSGQLFLYLKGIASDAIMALTGWDALSVGEHGIAINFVDDGGATGHLRWALDGVVQSNVTADGTYVPPTSAEPFYVGLHAAGNLPCLLADVSALREYSTALSDGDLVIASTPGPIIPAVTGTVAVDLDVSRDFDPGWYDVYTGAATTRWRLTINGGLKKRAR